MKNILSDLAYDITQLIKGSGRILLMYDEDGNRTYDQRQASKIFAYPDKMMIMITDDGIDSTVDIGLSSTTDVIELQDFINTLRHLTTNYNVLFNIQKYGKEIEPKDFANYGPTDIAECLDYYNMERVDELFNGGSDIEITNLNNDRYTFTIDYSTYIVRREFNGEIIFSIRQNGREKTSPVKNNKNQFLVLNTVVSIIKKLIESNPYDISYFSGDLSNGLAKVYSAMAKILKNDLPSGFTLLIPEPKVKWDGDEWEKWNFTTSPQYYYIVPDTDDGLDMLDAYQEFLSGNVNEASLSDYKTIKNNDWGLPENLIEWLKGKGFKMIGEGHYSYVFSSESEDFVVKVNNGERMDKGYLEFVEFCRQNKGNPHLPKIGTVKKYDNWYIVFIEKLEEFEELGGYSKIKLVVDIKDEADNWKTSITGDIAKQVKDCGKLLKQIKYLGDDDFHVDNLMKRGDTLVITDPLR